MQITLKKLSDTKTAVTVVVDEATLKLAKQHALDKLSRNVKIAGFRAGKAPAAMVEKALDPSTLQAEFIDEALNHSFQDVLKEKNLRPVVQPKVELTKFVPYSVVEYTAEVETIGTITLPDYKAFRKKKEAVKITKDEIDQVIANMRRQLAERHAVERPAKDGDQVTIDFKGTDEKGAEVQGASGTAYPLLLGSKSFIPGFEDNLIGLKAGEEKTFTLQFPADYGVKAMQNRKVTFACTVTKVEEVVEPPVDEAFVSKVNPELKDVQALRADIESQLKIEKQRQADTDYDAAVVDAIANKAKLELPESLIEDQAEAVMRELRQNLTYRGLTYQEYCENYGITEEEQREKEVLPEAKRRLKAGLVLSEIAEKENITVTPEELEIRLQLLKGQYQSDPQMQAELDKPENRRDIAARLLTEKTIRFLTEHAAA